MEPFAWILVAVASCLMVDLPVAISSVAPHLDRRQQLQRPVVVCYLGSWANYRQGAGKFLIEDIDASLCTHLVYGFAKLAHDDTIAPYDPYLDLKENWGLGAFDRFTGLKQQYPHLKTLLAVGGWNEGSTKYSKMAASARERFATSCVTLLRRHGFDGLDLDWEYPAARGGKPHDKHNFVKLLQELKKAFEPHGFLLTAAVSAGKDTIDKAYDIPALARYLDLINLMAYDFHGGWDKSTGHNSPLYPRPEEGPNRLLNVDYAVQYWLKGGAHPSKLILGMPLYGRSFTLRNASNHALDAPVTGKGMAGEFTRERGFMGYNEICHMLQKEKGWKLTLDKHVQAPYVVKGTQWIGFDDVKSIKEKVKYLKKMKLGGAMVWSLETDDFRGTCHGQKYPLLQAIHSALGGDRKPSFNIPNEIDYQSTQQTPNSINTTTMTTKFGKPTPVTIKSTNPTVTTKITQPMMTIKESTTEVTKITTNNGRSTTEATKTTKPKMTTINSRSTTEGTKISKPTMTTKNGRSTIEATKTTKPAINFINSRSTTEGTKISKPTMTTKNGRPTIEATKTTKPKMTTNYSRSTTEATKITKQNVTTKNGRSTIEARKPTMTTIHSRLTTDATKVTKPTVTTKYGRSTTVTTGIAPTETTSGSTKGWTVRDLPCSKGGYFRHPFDCSLFYLCQPLRPGMDAGFVTFLFSCGVGTVFSQELRTCAFPRSVPGC